MQYIKIKKNKYNSKKKGATMLELLIKQSNRIDLSFRDKYNDLHYYEIIKNQKQNEFVVSRYIMGFLQYKKIIPISNSQKI